MKEKSPKNLAVVILAAGKGTRMNSSLPKALHEICGKPMLWHLIARAKDLGAKKIVVVAGYKIEQVRAFVGNSCQVVEQKPQAGSGHAVSQAAKALSGFKGPVMVLYCDTPLVSTKTLSLIVDNHVTSGAACTLLSVKIDNPAGYGRIKRSEVDNSVEKIVEHNDASESERAIREINVGCYAFQGRRLFEALALVKKNAAKKEYYLTDAIELLAKDGKVEAVLTDDLDETHGINTPKDLLKCEELMQLRVFEELMEKGVRLRDLKTTRIQAGVKIGAGSTIESHTVIEDDSVIGHDSVIGPFARIRGGSTIGNQSVIGNFVEIVRSHIGNKVQVKHLSYLGDTTVADGVNVGAGSITANFDGKKKSRTIIKEGAQIGSGTILIAPVTIGRQSKTGAGSVVTRGKNVKDKSVVVGVPAKVQKGKN